MKSSIDNYFFCPVASILQYYFHTYYQCDLKLIHEVGIRYEAILTDNTEEELKAIDKEVRKQVDEEVEKAKNAPFADNSHCYTNITSPDPPSIRKVNTALEFLQ